MIKARTWGRGGGVLGCWGVGMLGCWGVGAKEEQRQGKGHFEKTSLSALDFEKPLYSYTYSSKSSKYS